ncbi:flagellar protein FlgN [Oxalobacteraceae bacterium OM1]|nr:flagellar protein FlgN [Oxalobacteraceae bacterium OM1]
MQALGNNPAVQLDAELHAANALLELLKHEQARLVEADVDGVAALTEEKTRLVSRLTELALQRHQRLGQAGFEAGERGMRDWLQSDAAPADARRAWNDLIQAASQSKDLNRTNGLMIGQQLARTQGTLDVLTGAQPTGTMYGPNGQAAPRAQNRGFVVG